MSKSLLAAVNLIRNPADGYAGGTTATIIADITTGHARFVIVTIPDGERPATVGFISNDGPSPRVELTQCRYTVVFRADSEWSVMSSGGPRAALFSACSSGKRTPQILAQSSGWRRYRRAFTLLGDERVAGPAGQQTSTVACKLSFIYS